MLFPLLFCSACARAGRQSFADADSTTGGLFISFVPDTKPPILIFSICFREACSMLYFIIGSLCLQASPALCGKPHHEKHGLPSPPDGTGAPDAAILLQLSAFQYFTYVNLDISVACVV